MFYKKRANTFSIYSCYYQMAGVTGIEPALMVLETTVLPLYDTPKYFLFPKSNNNITK